MGDGTRTMFVMGVLTAVLVAKIADLAVCQGCCEFFQWLPDGLVVGKPVC